jgi:hypothetical protein
MRQKRVVSPDGFHEEYSSTVDLIYLIKLNRIGRHFSAEELSFLIGRNKAYITSREKTLSGTMLQMDDVYMAAFVFDREIASMYMRTVHGHNRILVRASSIKKKNGKIVYTIEQKTGDGEVEMLCQVYEYCRSSSANAQKVDKEELVELIKILEEAVREGCFDEELREPLEIFRYCREKMKKEVHPWLLEKALTACTKSNQYPRLQKCKGKNGFGYKKITAGIDHSIENN